MASKWIGLIGLITALDSALVVSKPITSRDLLKPKVEIEYANITGRVSGNIKEFLGASCQAKSTQTGSLVQNF